MQRILGDLQVRRGGRRPCGSRSRRSAPGFAASRHTRVGWHGEFDRGFGSWGAPPDRSNRPDPRRGMRAVAASRSSLLKRPQGLGHRGGRLPAIARLLLQRLPQDAFQALGGVGAVRPQRHRRVLEDHAVGVGLARIEVEIGVMERQQVVERRAGAVDVGRLLDVAEVADVVGGEEADRAADVPLVGQRGETRGSRGSSWPGRSRRA